MSYFCGEKLVWLYSILFELVLQRKTGGGSNIIVTQRSSFMEQICAWSSSENQNTHKLTDLNFKHDIYTVKQPQLWPHLVNIPGRAIINDFNAYVHSARIISLSILFYLYTHINVWIYVCLLQIGRSQIFLVSPDTKKVAIEKSFREISFCSQVCSVMLTIGCCGSQLIILCQHNGFFSNRSLINNQAWLSKILISWMKAE